MEHWWTKWSSQLFSTAQHERYLHNHTKSWRQAMSTHYTAEGCSSNRHWECCSFLLVARSPGFSQSTVPTSHQCCGCCWAMGASWGPLCVSAGGGQSPGRWPKLGWGLFHTYVTVDSWLRADCCKIDGMEWSYVVGGQLNYYLGIGQWVIALWKLHMYSCHHIFYYSISFYQS